MSDMQQSGGGPLSTNEQQQLSELESIVAAGLQTFVQVGASLATIRDSRLYRAEYATFESYCDERWGLGRVRAYQIIDAAAAAQNVQDFTQNQPAPAVESHAAALARLPSPDMQREAWQEATRRAQEAGKRLTAAQVRSVVEGMLPSQSSQPDSNGTAQSAGSDVKNFLQEDPQPEQLPAAPDDDDLGRLLDELAAGQPDMDSLLDELAAGQPDMDSLLDELAAGQPDMDSLLSALDNSPDDILTDMADETADALPQQPVDTATPMELASLRGQIEALQGENERLRSERESLFQNGERVTFELARARAELRAARQETDNLHRANAEELKQASETIARLDDELQAARAMPGEARAILEEYRQAVSKAQQYKPASTRGEAVSPLLRCIERIAMLLQVR
jgi:hypothetical protein